MLNNHPLVEIPKTEIDTFKKLIQTTRRKVIPTAKETVSDVFTSNSHLREELLQKNNASALISSTRELAWQKFLLEEALFNEKILKLICEKLETPNALFYSLLEKFEANDINMSEPENLKKFALEYSGELFPYMYVLSLSNTQSRRTRAGSTFEHIIYQFYRFLDIPFESQKSAGTHLFESAGLGKKVDSVLPSVDFFNTQRNKAIIGTMKTSLRERWQEVTEEIDRTNIPVIHLLTVDTKISKRKARAMAKHNIVIVAFAEVAHSQELSGEKNIISFEEYLFEEIPSMKSYWN